jgi:hypothetical protein
MVWVRPPRGIDVEVPPISGGIWDGQDSRSFQPENRWRVAGNWVYAVFPFWSGRPTEVTVQIGSFVTWEKVRYLEIGHFVIGEKMRRLDAVAVLNWGLTLLLGIVVAGRIVVDRISPGRTPELSAIKVLLRASLGYVVYGFLVGMGIRLLVDLAPDSVLIPLLLAPEANVVLAPGGWFAFAMFPFGNIVLLKTVQISLVFLEVFTGFGTRLCRWAFAPQTSVFQGPGVAPPRRLAFLSRVVLSGVLLLAGTWIFLETNQPLAIILFWVGLFWASAVVLYAILGRTRWAPS